MAALYGIGQAIIFLPCGFCLSFFFILLLLSAFFPGLFSAVGDWMSNIHDTSTHGVALLLSANLECRFRGSLYIQDAKITQKIAICATSHKFFWLYLRN